MIHPKYRVCRADEPKFRTAHPWEGAGHVTGNTQPGLVCPASHAVREGRPLGLDPDEVTEGQVVALLLARDFDDWSQALSWVGFCANPVRLVGRSETFDTTTGALVPLRLGG